MLFCIRRFQMELFAKPGVGGIIEKNIDGIKGIIRK